jgi:pilus assembly protein CpaD
VTSFTESKTMYRFASLAAAAGFGLLLAGCQYDEVMMDNYQPTAVNERYPIRVTEARTKTGIRAPRGTLNTEQGNAVANFAIEVRRSSAPRVEVLYPSGGGASRQLAQSIAASLVDQGVPQSRILVRSYAGGASSPIELVLTRKVAVTRECGDWSSDLSYTGSNEPHSNFGCATQQNIAAMIANPEDLERPRETGPVLAANRMQTMKVFVENKTAGAYWQFNGSFNIVKETP